MTPPLATFGWLGTRGSPAGVPLRRAPLALALAALVSVALAPPALAQEPAAAVILGTVTGAEGEPLADAFLVIVGTDLRTYSQGAGRYQLSNVPSGQQTLEIRLLGHRPITMALHLEPGEFMRVDVTMQVDPRLLETVEVVGLAREGGNISPTLPGFYDRRSRGNGYFFTRDEIQHMGVRQFTDVLRRVPGTQINLVSGPYGTSQVVQIGRAVGMSGTRTCTVQYYINGAPFPVSQDIGINNFIQPDEIAGIEIYSGASRIPPQFNSSLHGSRCGVVVIWTYAGEKHEKRKIAEEKKSGS